MSPAARVLRWSTALALLVALIVVPFLLFEEPMETLTAGLLSSEAAGSAIAVAGIGLLAGDIFLPVPSSLVAAVLGTSLGVLAGTLVGTIGLTLGCVIGYAAAAFGKGPAERLLGPGERERATAAFERHGILALALCRPVPVLAEASVLAAGALRVPFRRFLAVTTLANIGVSAVYASIGALAGGLWSFLAAFAAALAIPGIALALAGRNRRRSIAPGHCEK